MDIISELDVKLQPMRNELAYLRSEFKALSGRVNVLETHKPTNQTSALPRPVHTNHPPTLLQVINDSRRKLGFSPFSLESLNSPENAVAKFLVEKMQIPPILVNSIQMRLSEIRQTKTPGIFIVFIELYNISDCHLILRHVRNLPRDCNTLTYVPPALMDRYKKLEEIAYNLRHKSPLMKTSIRYSQDNLSLFLRKTNSDTWIQENVKDVPEANLSLIRPRDAVSNTPFIRPRLSCPPLANLSNEPTPHSFPTLTPQQPPVVPPKPTVPQPLGYTTSSHHTNQTSRYQPNCYQSIPETYQIQPTYSANQQYISQPLPQLSAPSPYPFPTSSTAAFSPSTSTTSPSPLQLQQHLYHQMEVGHTEFIPSYTYQSSQDTRNQMNSDGSIYSLIQRFEPSENC